MNEKQPASFVHTDEFARLTLRDKIHAVPLTVTYSALVAHSILRLDIAGFGDLQSHTNEVLDTIHSGLIDEGRAYRAQTNMLHAQLVGLLRSKKYLHAPFGDAISNETIRNEQQRKQFLFNPEYLDSRVLRALSRGVQRDLQSEATESYVQLRQFQQRSNSTLTSTDDFSMHAYLYPDAFEWVRNAREAVACPYVAASSIRFKRHESALIKAARTLIKHADELYPGKNPIHLRAEEKVALFNGAFARDIGGIMLLFIGESDEVMKAAIDRVFGLINSPSMAQYYEKGKVKNRYEDIQSVLNDLRVVLTPTQSLPPEASMHGVFTSTRNSVELFVSDYKHHGILEFGPRAHTVQEQERIYAERKARGEVLPYKDEQYKFLRYLLQEFRFPANR